MTDENKTGDKDVAKPGKFKKGIDAVTGVNDLPEGKTKRTIYYITGISDIYFIFASVKQSFSLLFQRASYVKKQIKNLDGPPADSDANQPFDEVVKNSSIPLEQHLSKAGKYKKYWLCCFFIAFFVALFLIAGCVKLIVNTEYNVSLLKVTLTLGLIFSVCIYSFVKAMTYEFLGWQLRNEAHSEEEFGTLRYFINDNGVRNTFKFEQAGQIRGAHE
ncbi:TPA: TraX-like protein [Salmonella enterica]|nr:TraX-like protein [Salmonella enterica]